MGRQERTNFYKDNRDYGSLLDGEELEDDEFEEDDGDGGGVPAHHAEEEDFSQECQDYLRRRERFKELARQELRKARENGRGSTTSTKKPLPFDNYGSFFGPSEPVVARRVIEDARAREEASKLAKLVKNEVGIHKGHLGTSKSSQQPRVSESVKQSKPINQTALRLQRLKEARDYSFLFKDEDPTTSSPNPTTSTLHPTTSGHRNGVHESASRKQEQDNQNHTTKFKKSDGMIAQKGLPLTKSSSSTKMPRPNLPPAPHKGQERQIKPIVKPSKPPEKPPLMKPKSSSSVVSSSSSNLVSKKNSLVSSHSNSNKMISGPGRPPQSRPSVSVSSTSLSAAKKPSTSAGVSAQVRSLVSSGPKVSAAKQQLPSSRSILSKAPPTHSASGGNKSHVVTLRADQKRPGVVVPGRTGSGGGHVDARRPLQSGASSKQQMRPPQKLTRPPAKPVQKRGRDIESEDDSFVDDDDDLDGGDVSSMIHRMFRYNPSKYRDLDDEDDRNMEADFRTIQMEEKRSARIAREEDERELELIEEEERQERERARAKKKRKLQKR